jgi:hypothetical protein
MYHDIYSRQWQCTMKFLLVTESLEIFIDVITLSITTVTTQTSNFSNSAPSADLSMALLILPQRLHYCLTFHGPCLFRNFATSRRGPSKISDAMCDNPFSCFKMITLTNKEFHYFCGLLPNSSHLLLDQVILLHMYKMVFILP